MALLSRSTIKSDYPFLAHPPQKKVPIQPLPPTPCSPARNVFSAIVAWASRVQPGSPAASLSPRSPHRYFSCKRRRSSTTSTPIPVPSPSFLHVAPTPTTAHLSTTPSVRDFKADLTTLGYTSVFLQLPSSPLSASLAISFKHSSPKMAENVSILPVPSSTQQSRGLNRLPSLSAIRSRARSKSACPEPASKVRTGAVATPAAVVKRKKSKYGERPPPLSNELALMQFADGGGMDRNVRRAMAAQSKGAQGGGVSDVYRSGNGVWWDQDEEYEYTHLLANRDASSPLPAAVPQWVTFDNNVTASRPDMMAKDCRDSLTTIDSATYPRQTVQPINAFEGSYPALLSNTAATPVTRNPVPLPSCTPGMSILAVPSRAGRHAHHLRKADYLVNVALPPFPITPNVLQFPTHEDLGLPKPESKRRRRPAPLQLSPPGPAFQIATNSPFDVEKARREFMADSFKPVVSAPVTPMISPANGLVAGRGGSSVQPGLKKKPSTLMGRFRSRS